MAKKNIKAAKRAGAVSMKAARSSGASRPRVKASRKVINHYASTAEPFPIARVPSGFRLTGQSGLLMPTSFQPVEAGKLKKGISEAKRQLDDMLHEVLSTFSGSFGVKQVKLVASFSADGKFLGFGVGGAASIEITIGPVDE